MSTVRKLHDQAMKLAQEAMAARQKGDVERAVLLARDAYQLEQKAADQIPEDPASEPTRSILYRSAASLALQSKEYNIAQRLVARGLSGHPPSDVEEELHDIYAQINFERHLLVRGVTLTDEELQIAIDGKAVGHGAIIFKEYLNRIKSAGMLIDRTGERLMNKEFQPQGRRPKMFKPMTKTITTGREGSFAVTIRLGYTEGEQMSVLVTPEQVIDELIIGMELVNNGNEEALKVRISDHKYYTNFMALARDIAPDGEEVNFVGFTSTRRAVAFTRPNEAIELDKPIVESISATQIQAPRNPIEVDGVLDIAIGRGNERLGLMADNGKEYEIVASEGLEDLVRSYFKQVVRVKGEWDGKYIHLTSLTPIEE